MRCFRRREWNEDETSGASVLVGKRFPVHSTRAQVQTQIPPGARPVTADTSRSTAPVSKATSRVMPSTTDVIVFCHPVVAETRRHHPVVYALHRYSIGAEQWAHRIHVPQTIEGAFAEGTKEMIVVLPDSKTVHNGWMPFFSKNLCFAQDAADRRRY